MTEKNLEHDIYLLRYVVYSKLDQGLFCWMCE